MTNQACSSRDRFVIIDEVRVLRVNRAAHGMIEAIADVRFQYRINSPVRSVCVLARVAARANGATADLRPRLMNEIIAEMRRAQGLQSVAFENLRDHG